MIHRLHIQWFKSIRDLELDCRRINVFIGQPNVGKSNILEALGMFSFLYYSRYGYSAREFVRFERTGNLFYDENLDKPIEINCDGTTLSLGFVNGRFEGMCDRKNDGRIAKISGDHNDFRSDPGTRIEDIAQFKFYRFKSFGVFSRIEPIFLFPPSGENLQALLLSNKDLRTTVSRPFLSVGLRLGIRPQEGRLEVVKEVEDVIVSYPYSLASETLQRLTFYTAAILSNKESVLIFEEPESHSFPFYTKQLAEEIALDDRKNQYFISTHNPYFLLPLLAKASRDDIVVNIIYFEDFETKARALTEEELSELMEIDVFSNLERYLEKR